jgi:hypothetical protein
LRVRSRPNATTTRPTSRTTSRIHTNGDAPLEPDAFVVDGEETGSPLVEGAVVAAG